MRSVSEFELKKKSRNVLIANISMLVIGCGLIVFLIMYPASLVMRLFSNETKEVVQTILSPSQHYTFEMVAITNNASILSQTDCVGSITDQEGKKRDIFFQQQSAYNCNYQIEWANDTTLILRRNETSFITLDVVSGSYKHTISDRYRDK